MNRRVPPAAGDREAVDPATSACERMGALVAEAWADTPAVPSLPAWRALEAALDGAAPRPRARRRWLLAGSLAVTMAAGLTAAIVVLARPVRVTALEGVAVESGNRYVVPAAEPGTLTFSDGSAAVLAPNAALKVELATQSWRGVAATVERGIVTFSVKHRLVTSWHVNVGGSDVHVTGTRFDVGVSPTVRGRAWVRMHEGTVQVSGGVVAAGLSLEAGQTLWLDAARGRYHVSTTGEPLGAEAELDDAPRGGTSAPAHASPRPPAIDVAKDALVAKLGDGAKAGRGREAPRRLAPRSVAAAPASPPADEQDAVAAFVVGARRLSPPPLAPSPHRTEAPRLGAGGGDCLTTAAQFEFETSSQGAFIDKYVAQGFTEPVATTERSYCGLGALTLEAHLAHEGRLYSWGKRAKEWGALHLKVGGVQDFSGRTVEAYVYVDAPEGARFTAQLAAISAAKYVMGERREDLVPGRWHRLSYTFPAEVKLPAGGDWHVRLVDKLIIEVQCHGTEPCWSGRAFFDHISWH